MGDDQRRRQHDHHRTPSTGLVNGTRYYFRVFAHNAAGNCAVQQRRQRHPAHGARSGVVLLGHRVLRGLRPLWGDPVSTGGSPVTRFVIVAYDYDTGSWFVFDDNIDPSWRGGFIDAPGEGCGTFSIAAVNAAGVGPFSAPVEDCYLP